jgi:PST family polysaccharide transporter
MNEDSATQSGRDSLDKAENIKSNIGQKAVRSSAITISSQVIKVVIQTISIVVLARLFTPQDFGLIAMVSAIFGFLQIFQDFGLSTATIQRKSISYAQISNLFWINILLSGCLTLCCASIGPLVAWFYKEPRIASIAVVLSMSFLIVGVGTQHRAILMRQMQFGRLALVELSAMILSIISAIVLRSFGYWALTALSLVSSLATTLGLWMVCDWRPSMPRRNTEIKSMLNFGYNLSAVGVMNYLNRNLDNVLIGKVWGSTQLGFYSRAYNLFLIPISQIVWPIASVLTPVLSRLQDDDERFRKYFLSAVNGLAVVTTPIGFFLFIMAEEVIFILYGSKWHETIPIFRYLSISIIVQPILSSINWLYVATGRGRAFLKNSAIGSFVIILSFIIGLPYGPSKVAMCYSIAVILWTLPSIHLAVKNTPFNIKDVLRANIPAFISSVVSGLSIFCLKISIKSVLPDMASAIICFLVMTFMYVFCMFRFSGQKDMITSMYGMFKKRNSSAYN